MQNLGNKLCYLVLLLIACLSNACIQHKPDFAPQEKIIDVEQKEVDVYTFKKIDKHYFNFNTNNPTMLENINNILYMANESSRSLFAWDVESGNDEKAWTRLRNFAGSDAHAHYDLNTGNRTILRLGPAPDGVLVALSSAKTGDTQQLAGVARFYRQNPKAIWSRTFVGHEAHQNWPTKVHDLAEWVDKDGTLLCYAVVQFLAPRYAPRRYVMWGNSLMQRSSFLGVNAQGSVLKFATKDSSSLSEYNKIAAFSLLPDGRLLLADTKGLRSIQASTVGLDHSHMPRLEQQQKDEVLDTKHHKQWQKDSKIKEIVAMRLVDNRYLVVLTKDKFKFQHVSFADIKADSLQFEMYNKVLEGAHKIVVNGDEAKIVSKSIIYNFKDGKIEPEITNKFSNHQANFVKNGREEIEITEFKGGNAGDIPIDGVKFYDAAPHLGDWFYATEKGLYHVSKNKEAKAFNR